jgi:DNA-directed RNA polymerase subunit RPC12/RpoP
MGALTQFACTACGKTLKSPKPIPEGTKVRCPKCTKVFVVGNGSAGVRAGNPPAAPPRRSGGDLSTAPPRRPTRAEKRPRSNPLVMWGTCFFVALLFSVIVWIPARMGISAAQSNIGEMQKDRPKDWEKDVFNDPGKHMEPPMKDLDRPKDKMD